MYMGNTTAKSRGDVAGGDEIKNTRKYREGGRQSKSNGKIKGNHSGGGYLVNNSKPHKPSSVKNKRNVESSLRVSVLINESHKNCPKGPPRRKFKEDIL
uniref:Uncharacterized protein n=1 Tax=viral metagenome TaxID=1070528 RepID=A0A6C0HND0_9ZZZZ